MCQQATQYGIQANYICLCRLGACSQFSELGLHRWIDDHQPAAIELISLAPQATSFDVNRIEVGCYR